MSTCSDYLTDITNKYDDAGYAYDTGYGYWEYLNENWETSPFDYMWRLCVTQSIGSLYNITRQLIWCTGIASGTKRIPYYLANCVGDAAIDMDSIINAMLPASFDQLQKFIGLVDAYRVALWNAPFNADFYAALARGFQQWPEY